MKTPHAHRAARVLLGLTWIALLPAWGCGRSAGGDADTSPAAPAAAARDAPKGARIASMVPSLTEIVYDAGLGARVVGVSDFDVWPPEVAEVPRLGGLFNPNLERLTTLRPDLLLLHASADKAKAHSAQLGITTLALKTDTLDDVFACYRAVGEATGEPARAAEAAARLRAGLERERAPAGARPVVTLLVVGRDPGALTGLTSVGEGAFLEALLELAGGRNAASELQPGAPWPRVSPEQLVAHPPEAIVELRPGLEASDAARREVLAPWQALEGLEAVKRGRVVVLTGPQLLVPGPRMAQTVRALREALDPIRASLEADAGGGGAPPQK